MEILIILFAAFGLLFLLGVDVTTLLSILQVLLTAVAALSTIFFVMCIFMLMFSKKKKARLIGLEVSEKNKGDNEQEAEQGAQKQGMRFAHYLVDGEKLVNWFPAENVLQKRIYEKKEVNVRVARCGKKKVVFDRHSTVIVIAGAVLMGLSTFGLTVYWLTWAGIIK